jgi:long-subunit acyl-CoA synthetase (AMP-forming)
VAALWGAPAGRLALDDGQARLTYRGLHAALSAEGRWLSKSGGERFAVLADNGIAWTVADLALHVLGKLSVPLPGYFTDAQIRHALDDAGVDSFLTDSPDRVQRMLADWRIDGRSAETGLTLLRRDLDAKARPEVPPGTAKITYTSGSTAAPKGVCLSATHLETVAGSLAKATSTLDIRRHLCLLPLATLLENIAGVLAPLLAGATCLLPPTATTGISYAGTDTRKLLFAVSAAQPESLILVPELLQLFVVAAERGWPVPASLKFIAVGGASVSPSLLERAIAVGLPVYEGYGLSECASVVCLNAPGARRPGSVGKPLPHLRVRFSAAGEIIVSGPKMLGYLGAPDRAAQDEWHTGDLGEIDADGYVYVRGRVRNVFITSYGRNVAPEWVEREIAQRLPQRPVLVHGEAQPYAVAIVSGIQDEAETAIVERVIADANAALPDYARVHRWAVVPEPFSFANGMLTSNGRLRRAAIVERHRPILDALYAGSSPA